jgi:hypothetical protein
VSISESQYQAFEALDHAERMFAIGCASDRLRKLTVAELRVLHKHYFGKLGPADEMRKQHLIEELASEVADDER